MSPRKTAWNPRRAAVAALPLIAALSAASGCSKVAHLIHRKTEPTPAPIVPVAKVKVGPQPPKIDFASVRPNELGRIPVVMYHEIGGKDDPRDPNLNRTVAEFRGDIQALYDAGFRPVNMSDVVENHIDIPAGKSPVVLTFDDARQTQFKLIEQAKSMQVDPNSAVGVLEDFHKQHPDWALKGTFYILPKSKATLEPFGQLGMGDQKMAFLIHEGFEIGNHTTLHKRMTNMSPAQIQEEVGNANNEILAAIPDAKIVTMAVPMGLFPHKENVKYLVQGSYQGKAYEYKAALAAAWRPIPSPASVEFNPMHLERVAPTGDPKMGAISSPQGGRNYRNGLRDWVNRLSHPGDMYQAYVSDGDPDVISYPKGEDKLVNTALLKSQGKLAYAYSPFGGAGGSKPIVAAGDSAAPSGSAGAASAGDGGTAAADGAPKPIAVGGDTAAAASVTEKPAAKPISAGG